MNRQHENNTYVGTFWLLLPVLGLLRFLPHFVSLLTFLSNRFDFLPCGDWFLLLFLKLHHMCPCDSRSFLFFNSVYNVKYLICLIWKICLTVGPPQLSSHWLFPCKRLHIQFHCILAILHDGKNKWVRGTVQLCVRDFWGDERVFPVIWTLTFCIWKYSMWGTFVFYHCTSLSSKQRRCFLSKTSRLYRGGQPFRLNISHRRKNMHITYV